MVDKENIIIEKKVLQDGLMRRIHDAAGKGAFDLLILLLAHADENFVVQIKRRTLQDLTGFPQVKIHRMLIRLEEAGFVKRLNPDVRRVASKYKIFFS